MESLEVLSRIKADNLCGCFSEWIKWVCGCDDRPRDLEGRMNIRTCGDILHSEKSRQLHLSAARSEGKP